MVPERQKTLQALQTALQMETDGKKFYLKSSREAANAAGKQLFSSLAAEEDLHARKFTEIYDAITANRDWPATDFRSDGGRHLRNVFSAAIAQSKNAPKGLDTELAAVSTAMAMENKTFDYYRKMSQQASYPTEREFYEALVMQEKEHHLTLLDYFEYLKDPAAWFVKTEHPSLDGG